jgi:hypothetical protein
VKNKPLITVPVPVFPVPAFLFFTIGTTEKHSISDKGKSHQISAGSLKGKNTKRKK